MKRFFASMAMAATVVLFGFAACQAAADDDLIKMAKSGVDEEVLLAFIKSSPDTFNLEADDIITLKDLGVPSNVIAEALLHGHASDSAAMASAKEQIRSASTDTAADTEAAPPAEEISSTAAVAPAAGDQNISFFYQALYPYGSWLNVDGDWCWQPNATTISPDWAPYCRHGHWVYSDWGWCWQSDYSWGWAPFHYGRWFRHHRHGWCWLPDNEWGPAWVAWRHDHDYCGWAPLPPHSRIGRDGTYYRNSRVRADFEFNLTSQDYFFLPQSHFSDAHPWVHVVPQVRVEEVYRRTRFDHDAWRFDHDHFFNRGPAVEEISRSTNRTIKPIMIVPENLQPGQPIHRTTVRNDRMLIYRPNIAPTAPQNPSVVKTVLEKRNNENQARRSFVSPRQVQQERDISKQVLERERSNYNRASRENENLERAVRREPDASRRSQLQGEADMQAFRAQQAQSHLTRIRQWDPPSTRQQIIVPQSRVSPTPPPERREQVSNDVRTIVHRDAMREVERQRNVEQMVRRSPPPAAPAPATPPADRRKGEGRREMGEGENHN